MFSSENKTAFNAPILSSDNKDKITEYAVFNEKTVPMFSSENKDDFEVITNKNLYLLNIALSFDKIEDLNQLDKQVKLTIIENNKI
jgi:hypothetical protein